MPPGPLRVMVTSGRVGRPAGEQRRAAELDRVPEAGRGAGGEAHRRLPLRLVEDLHRVGRAVADPVRGGEAGTACGVQPRQAVPFGDLIAFADGQGVEQRPARLVDVDVRPVGDGDGPVGVDRDADGQRIASPVGVVGTRLAEVRRVIGVDAGPHAGGRELLAAGDHGNLAQVAARVRAAAQVALGGERGGRGRRARGLVGGGLGRGFVVDRDEHAGVVRVGRQQRLTAPRVGRRRGLEGAGVGLARSMAPICQVVTVSAVRL